MLKGANSIKGDEILTIFKLIQAVGVAGVASPERTKTFSSAQRKNSKYYKIELFMIHTYVSWDDKKLSTLFHSYIVVKGLNNG